MDFSDLHAEFVWCTVRRNLDKSGPRKTCHFRLGEDAFIKQCFYSKGRVNVLFLDCHLCPFHVDEKLLKKERRNHISSLNIITHDCFNIVRMSVSINNAMVHVQVYTCYSNIAGN